MGPAMVIESSGASRVVFLDALRAVAASIVMLSHSLALVWPWWNRWTAGTFNVGHIGVGAFFVCSGYIIPTSIERSTQRGFWARRVFRLYPLYLLTLASVLAVIYGPGVTEPYRRGFDAQRRAMDEHPTRTALLNASMAMDAFGEPPFVLLAWTLWVEMVFYVTASAAVALGVHRRSGLIAVGLIGGRVIAARLPWFPRDALPFFTYLAVIWCGAAIRYRKAGWLGTTIAACPLAIVGADLARSEAYPFLVGVALFLVAYSLRGLPMPRTLTILGDWSYSIYLDHLVILILVPSVGPPAVSVVIWAALTLGMAWATHRWVERPWIELGRRVSGMFR